MACSKSRSGCVKERTDSTHKLCNRNRQYKGQNQPHPHKDSPGRSFSRCYAKRHFGPDVPLVTVLNRLTLRSEEVLKHCDGFRNPYHH
jgi:hypothetical protein